MSEPEEKNEPTMEEILASIRRIISEEEPAVGKAAAAPTTPPESAATKPAPAPAKAAVPPATPIAPAPAGAPSNGADNILDLTKMVAEDGSIVDLTAPPEVAAAEDTAGEAPAESAEPEGAGEPEAEPEAAPEEAQSEIEAGAEPVEEAPAPEAEPKAEPEAEPEPEAEAEAEPEAEAEAEAETEPEAEAEAVEKAPDDAATGQALAPAGDDSEYVSPETASVATSSLAAITKAAMANSQADAVAIGGGRTLEELVRQSLAPELKGWLDENLPELVERIVREEIRKMVRRAEDQ
jgi:hypothetical protein